MKNTIILSQILKIITALLILIILSFIYTYLTTLNPLIYFNVIIWYFFGALLIIPSKNIYSNNSHKYLAHLLTSCLTIYIVYGLKSSIFWETVKQAVLDNGSMWLPKVSFSDIASTFTSLSEYKFKLDFLLDFDTLNLSFKGREGVDTGAGFTNIVRIIECLGILIIPIYLSSKIQKKETLNLKIGDQNPYQKNDA